MGDSCHNLLSEEDAVLNRRLFSVPAEYLETEKKYHFNKSVANWETHSLASASLVSSSLVDSELHAPVLDFDRPAALVSSETGIQLWLQAPMSRRSYWKLLSTVVELGLCSPDRPELVSTWRTLYPRRRREAYQSVRHQVLQFAPTSETFAALATDSPRRFEEVLDAALTLVPPTAGEGPELRSPWVVPLDVPVFQAPSTHAGHSHLYLDAPLKWGAYVELLDVLAKAKVIEPGYRGASIARGMTCVRRPGIRKLTGAALREQEDAIFAPF